VNKNLVTSATVKETPDHVEKVSFALMEVKTSLAVVVEVTAPKVRVIYKRSNVM